MNKNTLHQSMSHKAKLHEETVPTDTFIELNRLALSVAVETDDNEVLKYVSQFRSILDEFNNQE